jgi:hypothetical protein
MSDRKRSNSFSGTSGAGQQGEPGGRRRSNSLSNTVAAPTATLRRDANANFASQLGPVGPARISSNMTYSQEQEIARAFNNNRRQQGAVQGVTIAVPATPFGSPSNSPPTSRFASPINSPRNNNNNNTPQSSPPGSPPGSPRKS